MWPWGHAAVGYLLYSLLARTNGDRPEGVALFALAVGTQFPDLVDKPLGWTVGLLPGGRTLAHSLFTIVALVIVVWLLTRRYGRREHGQAFLVGTVVHVVTDGLYPALEGEFGELTYLLWPVFPAPPEEAGVSIVSMFAELTLTPTVAFELGLGVVATMLWVVDGRPGLALLRAGGQRVLAGLGTD